MQRILGIDTGTNSLGWAVVDRDMTSGECRLVKHGSLIFQEGVKTEKGVESSRAAERSAHRSLRRQYFRRRLRKIEVLRVLVAFGWCPPLDAEALEAWHTRKVYPLDEAFLLWQRTDDAEGRNPYACRHRCLHETLDLTRRADRYTLGRAMYHLAQRRGFKSNRLDDTPDDDTEAGAVKQGISQLTAAMSEAGCEYLGDYFYTLYNKGAKIRSTYTDREEHYRREFHAICERQQLPTEQVTALERALYFQRPLRSQRHAVGRCTFEPSRQRCAVSHPEYEEFRLLSFLNNVRVQGPYDFAPRPLNDVERERIEPLFYRKSKPQFDFEDIAKAIAGKGKYQHADDPGHRAYSFNFRMTQSVSGCPTTAALRQLFGKDYARAMAEQYTLGAGRTEQEVVSDVWNALSFFPDRDHLERWGRERLQLSDSDAETFSKIRLPQAYASLSLAAIRRIVPWLRRGLKYPHAVMMAKVPEIVGRDTWEARGHEITSELTQLFHDYNPSDAGITGTLEYCIKDYLSANFTLRPGILDTLYHPSMINPYPDARPDADGLMLLGSPRTPAVRNPMAMRSLHEIRSLVNTLLREGIITQRTELHIEYARELNDANRRKAIAGQNKDRESLRAKYATELRDLYHHETGRDITPTDDDILRYELWQEQEHVCLYTGNEISVTQIVGAAPLYDIEHTVPRSVGGDFTRENLTLCESHFNRDVKRAKLPAELANHADILSRLEPWRERVAKLRKAIDAIRTNAGMDKAMKDRLIQRRHRLRLDLDYWQGKLRRFTMTDVPEGFARRQGAGIGLIGKYAGLYLRSLFHEPGDSSKSGVRVVKGAMTAEFRKLWGVQDEWQRKSRDNHTHHCIDAIVIACIQPGEHSRTAHYYREREAWEQGRGTRPVFPKPWPTFAEDMRRVAEETIVVHDTRDRLAKRARQRIATATGKHIAQGDSARASLHMDTYYGAIERDGEIRYVVRRRLADLASPRDVEKIVDPAVREAVLAAISERGFKEAMAGDVFLNREKGVVIRKVRCYADDVKSPVNIRQHRDLSRHDYKRQYHVKNDGNYLLAIYEGMAGKRLRRDYRLVRTIDAAARMKASAAAREPLVAATSETGLPLRHILRIGQHVLLYENTPSEIHTDDTRDMCRRLYVVTGLSYLPTGKGYGSIVMRHHQEARMAKDVKPKNGAYKCGEVRRPSILMLHTQFNALVEGEDFTLNVLGEITLRNPLC